MDVKSAIAAISSSEGGVDALLARIASKNKKTNKLYLEALTKLSYLLFIDGKENESLSILDILSDIDFDGSYEYWTWIEFAIVLRAFIARKNGDIATFDLAVGKLDAALNQGTELQKSVNLNVHKRFLSGDFLKESSLSEEGAPHDAARKGNEALIYTMQLLKLSVFVDSSTVSRERLDTEISFNFGKIRKIMSDGNAFALSPFK